MTNQHESSGQPRRAMRNPLPLILGVALLVIGTMAYSLFMGRRIAKRYAPLVEAAREIKLDAAIGHLWLEEVLSGDRNDDIDAVWKHFDQSAWYAQAMLEGGENSEGVFLPVHDSVLRREIQDVLSKIADFRSIGEQRWAAAAESGIGTESDQRFDALFEDFLAQADRVETVLQGAMARELNRFQIVQGLLITFCLGLFAFVGLIFRRYERRQAIAAAGLCASEERLRITLDAVSDGGWDWNVVTGEVYYSDRWLKSLGYERRDVPSHISFWERIVHPDDMPHTMEVLNAHFDGRVRYYECEHRLRTASGEYRWNLDRGRVVARDGAGKPLRMVGTDTDISERKRTEDTLRLTQFAVDQASDAIYRVRADGRISYVNRSACEALGYSYAELVSMSVPEIDPDFPQEDWAAHWDEMKMAGSMTFEARHQTKNGVVFSVEITTNHLVHRGEEYIWAYARNISERKQTENELCKLSVAVEQSPAAVVITDTNGTIEYVNPRFTEVTGYTKDEVIGRNPRILKSGKWPKKAYEGLWKTILAGKTWRGEFENKKKNGELYWESACISPVRNGQGEVTHFLAVKEDITNRKQREEELRRTKTVAEAANRKLESTNHRLEESIDHANRMAVLAEASNIAKSEFLANMSHEIRTPMTAILGFAENLLDADQPEAERTNCIDTIRRNGEHLLHVINDILDLSKIEAGKMTVELGDCQPCRVIAEVASLMRVRADAKGLPFNIEYIGTIPETIQSDPTRLRQILINLIANAIKFTETGTVRLVTRFVPGERKDPPCDGEDKEDLCPSVMQFDVVDPGRGMTEEQVAKLFQPFMQADSSTTRKFGGTGLGLTISKRFAELLGGDITVVDTKMGVGTTFRATVATGPLTGAAMLDDPMSATVVASNAGTTSGSTDQSDLHGCRILLAEDGPDNQRLISFVLKKAGADVTVEENGKLAAGAALAARDEGKPFDCILMDMQMPVMDGYKATGQLRRKGYTGPIIALTAHTMEGDRRKCIDAGCDDYATKPIDRRKLIALIGTYVSRGETVISTQEITPCPLVSELADDDMLEPVERFVSELPERVAAIKSALGEQDLAMLRALAQQLKGSAEAYGFSSIIEAAGLLESSAKSDEKLETLTRQTRALAELCLRARDGAVQRRQRDDVAPTPAPHELTFGEHTQGTVLVVDDDPDARCLFRKLLERDGFQVYEACDGIDALAIVPDIHPHVILMDVEMPNMDGLECTLELKADPALRNIPIIILSGKTDSRDVRAGLEAGAQEYITKPIVHDEFLLRVRAMNQLFHGEANLLESNAVRGEQARAMSILFDLSRSFAAAESLDAITQHTVTATAALMNSRRVSVMLPDETGQNLLVASAIGIADGIAQKIRVPVGSAIAGKVFATGEPTLLNSRDQAIDDGGRYESDFFASVPLASRALAVPNKVVGVLNVTERHDRRPFETHEIEYLDLVCNMTASAIERFQSGRAREHAHAAIVIGLAMLAEHRDNATGRHLERVTQFALLLARELRKSSCHGSTIDDRFLLSLEKAMPLHDIGKVSVSDAVLLKPGKLTDTEFTAMKRHVVVGADAIQSMIERAPEADFLLMARDIAQSHHEWFDGTGYPRGLNGDEIPLEARIAAVADVYDALTTKRPYKEAFPHEKAVGIIRDSSGSHFDSEVVDVFLRLERGFAELAQALRDESDDSHDEKAERGLVVCSIGGADPMP